MEFCIFQTAFEDEITIFRQVRGEPAASRLFQIGLRILLPSAMRSKCVMTAPTVNDPHELIDLRAILAELLKENREARPHEKQLAREAIAAAASQFDNRAYRESVFLWLTLQGFEDDKAAISDTAAGEGQGAFFP